MEIGSKVVVITGASSGIGMATARLLATHGAKVVLAARSTDKLNALAQELTEQGHEAFAITVDMRDKASVENMIAQTIAHYGQVDVLINNAAQSLVGTVADLNLDHFREILELNVFGGLNAMQAVIPHMRNAGGGLIVNISADTSRMTFPAYAGYASSKAMLNLISATARMELAPENIRVVTMLPRRTMTDFSKKALGDHNAAAKWRPARPANAGATPANMPMPDTAELVAEKILLAVRNEPAEQNMD